MSVKNILLYFGITLSAISISAEPLSHDHHEEDGHRHDVSCLIWHFVEIFSLEDLNTLILNAQFSNNFEGIANNSFQNTHSSLYSSRAPPKI
tara:strand:+ start:86 stop:361 length:276 start_codon:yes stop_codon:yes gene_type:complete